MTNEEFSLYCDHHGILVGQKEEFYKIKGVPVFFSNKEDQQIFDVSQIGENYIDLLIFSEKQIP